MKAHKDKLLFVLVFGLICIFSTQSTYRSVQTYDLQIFIISLLCYFEEHQYQALNTQK